MNNKRNTFFIIIVPILCALIVALFFYDRYQTSQLAEKFKEQNETADNTLANNTPNQTESLPAIYCVGDSITIGANNVTSYPNYLKKNLDRDVKTIGDTSINSAALSIILGANQVYVNNLTIPGDTSAVAITLLNQNGQPQNAILESKTNIDDCTINDIKGSISYNASNNRLEFKRSKAGESTKITALAEVKVTKPDIDENSVLVLFSGSYEESVQGSLAQYQKQIISAFNSDKYIVVSLTQNDRDATNTLLKNTHGDHYLDFKNYLLTDGLSAAGITATNQDKTNIANKNTPSSFLADELNGNNAYNELLAKQLVQKMNELGYLN